MWATYCIRELNNSDRIMLPSLSYSKIQASQSVSLLQQYQIP